jgi:hypothetical protein
MIHVWLKRLNIWKKFHERSTTRTPKIIPQTLRNLADKITMVRVHVFNPVEYFCNGRLPEKNAPTLARVRVRRRDCMLDVHQAWKVTAITSRFTTRMHEGLGGETQSALDKPRQNRRFYAIEHFWEMRALFLDADPYVAILVSTSQLQCVPSTGHSITWRLFNARPSTRPV